MDSVVIDCGGGVESFDPRRGHNGDGGWGMGKFNIAKHVAEAARKELPDFVPTMEGLGDLPGLYFVPMCSGVYWGGRNVYRYTFPERVLIHGMANAGSGGTPITRFGLRPLASFWKSPLLCTRTHSSSGSPL